MCLGTFQDASPLYRLFPSLIALAMPYKAHSERVKAINHAKSKEVKLQEAIDTYLHEQTKSGGDRKGAWKIAEEFGIGNQWRTIINRCKGGRSLREAHEGLQK